MQTEEQERLDTLEHYVDRYGLRSTLDALACICTDKAEHIRSNWQDQTTARPWEKAYKIMLRAHDALPK
jgi:hypothetical protein